MRYRDPRRLRDGRRARARGALSALEHLEDRTLLTALTIVAEILQTNFIRFQ
jgi:hypothetical protein